MPIEIPRAGRIASSSHVSSTTSIDELCRQSTRTPDRLPRPGRCDLRDGIDRPRGPERSAASTGPQPPCGAKRRVERVRKVLTKGTATVPGSALLVERRVGGRLPLPGPGDRCRCGGGRPRSTGTTCVLSERSSPLLPGGRGCSQGPLLTETPCPGFHRLALLRPAVSPSRPLTADSSGRPGERADRSSITPTVHRSPGASPGLHAGSHSNRRPSACAR